MLGGLLARGVEVLADPDLRAKAMAVPGDHATPFPGPSRSELEGMLASAPVAVGW